MLKRELKEKKKCKKKMLRKFHFEINCVFFCFAKFDSRFDDGDGEKNHTEGEYNK